MRWFAVLAGTALVLAGLILGFSGVSVGSVSCGSAFNPDVSAAHSKDLLSERVAWNLGIRPEEPSTLEAQCEEVTSGSRPTLAWVLLGGGALALAGGLLVRTREPA